jgi:hypothetical protein
MWLSASLALALACAPRFAAAEIYALAHDEAANATVLRDPASGFDSARRVENCCAIAVGTPTFDAAGDRAFFVAQGPAGPELVRFHYVSGSSQRLPLDPGFTVTHLEFHAATGQLFGLAREIATGGVAMVAINPLTAALTVRARPPAPCCSLKAGVSALIDSGNVHLLAVGRNAGSQEVILPFNFTSNSLGSDIPLPAGEQVTDLVRHPATGVVWGFSHETATGLGRPFSIGLFPGFPFVTVGPGHAGCCYALAGSAAIDQIANQLVFIGHAQAGERPALQRFSFSDGSRTVGPFLIGHGLFQDFGLRFDELFSDGFEAP